MMIPFPRYIRLTFASSVALLILSSAGWLLFPQFRTYLAGFILGLVFGMLNALITVDKTVKTSEYALGKRKRRQGTGQLQRFLLAGFAGYAALRFPVFFHWAGVLIGLVTVTFLSLVIALTYHLMHKTVAERGER